VSTAPVNRRAMTTAELTRGLYEQWRVSRRHPGWSPEYRRIYLHHVRKTGGTSITTAMLSLGGERPQDVERRLVGNRPRFTRTGNIVVAAHDRMALQTGSFSYGWSHVPAWRIHLPRSTFTITVLRDPVERVVSLYRYLVDPDSDVGHAFGAAARDRALARDGFTAFLGRAPREEILQQLYMFSRSLDVGEAVKRIEHCSLVFFTEDMPPGMSILADLVGRPLPLHTERKSRIPFAPSESQAAMLRERLRPEYDLITTLRPIVEQRLERRAFLRPPPESK